jgi:hypothetical protein
MRDEEKFRGPVRPRPTRRSLAATAFDVDAFEQVVELTLFDRNDARVSKRLRYPKYSTVQALVEDAQPGPIEEQDLERALALADEQKQRAAASRALHALLCQPRQPVEPQTHIDRLERDEDLDAVRDHRAPPSSAPTTARSRDGSNPAETSMRAWPNATTTTDGAAREGTAAASGSGLGSGSVAAAVTTRAKRTPGPGSFLR